MGVTFVKKQIQEQQPDLSVVHKPAMLVAQAPEEVLADELIVLTGKLEAAEVTAINKRIAEIKRDLQSIAKELPTDTPLTVKGLLGVVELGACSMTSKVNDMEGLLGYAEEKVGHEAMMSVVKVTLTDLKKVLSESEIDKFSERVPGSRVCKIMVVYPHAANQ